jgi:serine/threonine protein kinase
MKLKGGEFLGQGTYGCVFFPSIKCRDRLQQKEYYLKGVSKVFKTKKHMDDELKETNKISKMDKQGLYTNKALGSCEVSTENFSSEETGPCRYMPTSKKALKSSIYHQIFYEHKGIDLNQFMRKQYSLSDTFNYVLNLMKGIQLLIKHNYVHLDLKPDNVLISDSNKALLIDFGLGRPFKTLYDYNKSDYILEYSYEWYAPEFKLFFDSYRNMLPEYQVKEFIEFNNSKYNRAYLKYNKNVVESETKDLVTRYRREFALGDIGQPEYFIRNFAHKADVFSLGTIMYYIHKKAQKDSDFELYGQQFKNIFDKAIRINAYERATINELIMELENLINIKMMNNLSINKLPVPVTVPTSPPKPNKPNITAFDNIKTSSSYNKKFEECMQHLRIDLISMVEKYNLPKQLKKLKKRDLCKELIPHIEHEKYQIEQEQKALDQSIDYDYCMRYYTLNELKAEVSRNNLPPNLKNLHKSQLCTAILPYLKKKSNQVTIKRGPKRYI